MKAIAQDRYGSPDVLELKEFDRPVPGAGEVLVRVRAVSVNAYDWHLMRGDPYLARRFAMQPTHLRGAPSRAEIVARYGELTGRSMDAIAFYEVFGIFRLAVIAQQIYHRYATGGTTNPRFKNFWVLVRSAHRQCRRRILAA